MKILEKIKKLSLSTVVVALIAGVLFIAFPDKCIQYISIAVGVGLIAMALAAIISYFAEKSSAFTLVSGIILGILGIIICVRYRQVISFIVAVIGIFIIAAGVTNLLTGLKTIAVSVFFGWFTLLTSVVTIIFGLVAVLHASALTETLVRALGVGLIIYAVLDLVAFFEVRSIVKSAQCVAEQNGDIETDAVIVEETDE